jgi:hypothetical protein
LWQFHRAGAVRVWDRTKRRVADWSVVQAPSSLLAERAGVLGAKLHHEIMGMLRVNPHCRYLLCIRLVHEGTTSGMIEDTGAFLV